MKSDPKVLKQLRDLKNELKEIKKDEINIEPKEVPDPVPEPLPPFEVPIPKPKKRFFFFKKKDPLIIKEPIKPVDPDPDPVPIRVPVEKVDFQKKVKVIEKKAIPEKDLDKTKFYYEVTPFEYFKRSKLSIRYWKDRRMAKKYPEKVVLVRLEMNNGRHREFLVKEHADGFTYDDKKYIFDLDNKYYVVDSNIWAYNFHESFSLPIKKNIVLNPELQEIFDKIEAETRKGIDPTIPIDLIKETIEHSGITQIENAVNPTTLERVSESQFVQMILQGATLGKLFKILLIIAIISALIIAADLVVDLIGSGLLEELNIKGGSE